MKSLRLSAKIRILTVSAAYLCLGLSCADTESYLVESDSPAVVVDVVGRWANSSGLTRIDCAKYLDHALKDSCFDLGEPDRVPQYIVAVKMARKTPGIVVWIFFGGVTEAERSEKLQSLGEALIAKFQAQKVTLE